MGATGASPAWSIWGAGSLRSRRFRNDSSNLQLVRPASPRSACSIIPLAYTPTIHCITIILQCTVHKADDSTLRDNILHCAITYYIARYTKRVTLHCKPYSLHCITYNARFALCNALYHFTTYRLYIVSHVTRRNDWEFPTMIQVDTSVLYNDSRDLHVSVKGSSVSSC